MLHLLDRTHTLFLIKNQLLGGKGAVALIDSKPVNKDCRVYTEVFILE